LREVAIDWGDLVEQRLIIVVREVLDVSTLDEELKKSLGVIPTWLQAMMKTVA
jgi:hypothetical protein